MMDYIVGHGLASLKKIQDRMKNAASDLEDGKVTPRIAQARHIAWWFAGMILVLLLAVPLALTRAEDTTETHD